MPSKYESQDERINNFILNVIIPTIKEKRDANYNKVVKVVCLELGVKEDKVKQCLARFIEMGKIHEEHVLTISDEEVQGWLNNLVKKEKEQKEDQEKADKILEDLEK